MREGYLGSLAAGLFFLTQELSLFNLTLTQIDEEVNEQEANQTESKQKVERRAVIVRRARIDDCRRD
jgi:hypothetical protein